MKIEHFALNVADPRGMASWYVAHLGMHVLRAADAPAHTHFLADDAGMQIELYDDSRGPRFDGAGTHPQTWHLAFLAPDIEAERSRLLAAGATAVGEIATTPTGDRLAFLRDPFGFTLQLVKRAG
jgi:glyoxylase I family protein